MKILALSALLTLASLSSAAAEDPATTPASTPEWILRSNAQAEVLLEVYTRFNPEDAGRLGVTGVDNRVIDLGPARTERLQAAFTAAARDLELRAGKEKDPRVRQDLGILAKDAQLQVAVLQAEQRYLLPLFDVGQQVYGGVRALVNDQVAAERRPAAAIRLRRYAGLEEGYTPLTVLAEARMREQLPTLGLLFPFRGEIEQQLANSDVYLNEIGDLLKQYEVGDADKSLKELRAQVATFNAFVRQEILPRARDDFRLPAELYAVRLREVGVDIPLADLTQRARIAFMEVRNQMIALAPQVARQLDLEGTDYRDVIRQLRSRQIGDEAAVALYRERLGIVEETIRREKIVALPEREAVIRLATPSESAQMPAPTMRPPPLINNQGERGEFVLPVAMPPDGSGAAPPRLEDFTFDAATWTLIAHEARPGHELQYVGMVENHVSLARAVFAMNSVNAEGWALYAEAEMQPYLPLDGQLIALQYRLLRAARAFLDPGLQQGTITLEEVRRILAEEVVLTPAMTDQEIQRYTYRRPGQATSYFYGYQSLLDIRTLTELALGPAFDRQRFNDFVLGQGVLPPAQQGEAVRESFIPAELQRTRAGPSPTTP